MSMWKAQGKQEERDPLLHNSSTWGRTDQRGHFYHMGPLTPEPESILKPSLPPSSPSTPSSLDGVHSLVDGAPRFYMDDPEKERASLENARAGEGSIGGDKKEKRGYGIAYANTGAAQGFGTIEQPEVEMRKKLAALGYIAEDQRRPETMRRSLDSGYGGQFRTGRNSLGYVEEAKRASLVRYSFGYGEEDKRASLMRQNFAGYTNGDEKKASVMHGYGDQNKGGERGRSVGVEQVNYGDRDLKGGGLDFFKEKEEGRCMNLSYFKQGVEREERHDGEREEKRESVGDGGGKEREEKRENEGEGKKENGERKHVEKGKEDNKEKVGEEEVDYVHRGQWLRAAILGANDGLVSTASLMMGVGAIKEDDARAMVVSGLAGLVGGACSMAIGEFISVYSQRDAERYEKKRKTQAITEKTPTSTIDSNSNDIEQGQVTLGKFLQDKAFSNACTPKKGFSHTPFEEGRSKGFPHFMKLHVGKAIKQGAKVSREHKSEEEEVAESSIGPSPWEAAGASGLAFAIGAMVPLVSAGFIQNHNSRIIVMLGVCSGALICMGAIGAKLSAGNVIRGSIRVVIGGWAAMLVTYGLLRLFGTSGV